MGTVYKRESSKFYWIVYRVDGKRYRETTGTTNKRLADQCLASREGDIAQGKFKLANQRLSPTFKDFSQEYLEWARANKRSWDRDEIMVRNLMDDFGHLKLASLKPKQVEKFKIRRSAEVEKSTTNREVSLLKRIVNLAVEWQLIESNPIAKVKKFKEPPPSEFFLTQAEAKRLVDACTEPFRWIVITALHTGMRRNEILFLKWEHVNLVRRSIHVVNTKNGEDRHIPMDDTVFELLNSLPKISEYVFAQKNGLPYSWIGRAWKRALTNAGLQCRFHDLRHTFASHLVQNGANQLQVQKLLGHKSFKMVQRYAHLGEQHLREAVSALNDSYKGEMDTVWTQSGAVVDFQKASNG
jgi:integrase